MRQLLKTTIITFLLLVLANISHANNCATDLSECTPKGLCKIATVKSDSIFSWSNLRKAKKHVALAKNLGMDCGVNDVTDLCDNDPNECKINQLCEKATKVVNGNKIWDTMAQGYIDIAKKYNLSCDVAKKSKEKSCVQEPKNCNDTQLCKMGVVHGAETKAWDTTSKWIKHANEAKKRGLSCDVGVRTSLDIDKKLIVKKIVKKKCSQDARECNETQLCKMGVVLSSGKKVWNTLLGGVKYSKEAKKRGFSCGVKTKTIVKIDTADKKSCLKEPKLCNATDLCLIASTSTSTWSQNSTLKHYVTEAKKRGLSCGVKVFLKSTKKSVTKKKCSEDAKSCTNIALCLMAIKTINGKKSWDKRPIWAFHITEAKRRGLSCGVGNKAEVKKIDTKKKCSQDAKNCADTKLCSIATVYRNGIKKWNYNHYGAHINEAKRRGLYCGVNNNQKNQIKNASFSKSDFSRLNTIRRKQLQYGLKQLGFYRKSIDGLYGAGTEKAVRLYARSRGIKSGFPYSVYNKIITEVIIPSSFTVVTKPKPKSKPKPKAKSNAPLMDKATGQALGAALCTLFGGNAAGCIAGATGNTASNPYGSSTSSTKSSNSCISDVNCAYGYMCIKRVGRGGECMKKPAGAGIDFKPKECDYSTDCKIGLKCHSTYKVCVKR